MIFNNFILILISCSISISNILAADNKLEAQTDPLKSLRVQLKEAEEPEFRDERMEKYAKIGNDCKRMASSENDPVLKAKQYEFAGTAFHFTGFYSENLAEKHAYYKSSIEMYELFLQYNRAQISGKSLENIAVAFRSLARHTDDAEKQSALFDKSFANYLKAAESYVDNKICFLTMEKVIKAKEEAINSYVNNLNKAGTADIANYKNQKALALNRVGETMQRRVERTTDPKKKEEVWALAERYYQQAAELFTDPAQKAAAYNFAGAALVMQAELITDPTANAPVWAQAAMHFQQAAMLHTDPAQKAEAYHNTGAAKRKLAGLATDPKEKAEAWGQAAKYSQLSAELDPDKSQQATAYKEAGEAKGEQGKFITNPEEKEQVWTQAEKYFQQEAELRTDKAQKAEAYLNIGKAKAQQAGLIADPGKGAAAWKLAERYFHQAEELFTDKAQQAEASACVTVAKKRQLELTTDPSMRTGDRLT